MKLSDILNTLNNLETLSNEDKAKFLEDTGIPVLESFVQAQKERVEESIRSSLEANESFSITSKSGKEITFKREVKDKDELKEDAIEAAKKLANGMFVTLETIPEKLIPATTKEKLQASDLKKAFKNGSITEEEFRTVYNKVSIDTLTRKEK
jgi:hypothetical protein